MRPIAHALVVAGLAFAFAGPLAAADGYLELLVRDYDTIVLKNGAGTILGKITVINSDGSMMVEEIGRPGARTIQANQIERTEFHLTAAKVVEKRGAQALAKNDIDDVVKTLRWVDENATKYPETKEAALALGEKAVAKAPTNTALGSRVIAMYLAQEKTKEAEALARKLVQADPRYNEGYEFVAKALEADPTREEELKTWLNDWLKIQPTALRPNKYLAGLYERTGQLRQSQEAYRKCWTLHKDQDCGLGYARVSLRRGEVEKALDAATQLAAVPDLADEAKAIAGSAKLAQGDLAGATTLLQDALLGKLGDDSGKLVRYNLGYAMLRANQPAKARELWKDLGTPVAALALACLERKPFEQVESLPTPALKQLAKELNAAVGLEGREFALAGALDPSVSKRAQFLSQVAKVLQTGGSEASVREVAQTPGAESLRWQAYGHLLAGRTKECEAALAQLPADDGHALAYRLTMADAAKDQNRAIDLLKRLAASPSTPRDWLARVMTIYDSANDEFKDETFDWPEGDAPSAGWQFASPGTGIRIHVGGGQLLLDGVQTASADAVSRAWAMVRQDRLKQVKLELDISKVGNATAGLEVLDGARQNGIALGVRGDSRIAWRELKGGMWGQWQNLEWQLQGTKAALCIDYNNGRVLAFLAEEPTQKLALGPGLSMPSPELCIGVFGTADPGVEWKLAADGMQVYLRPVGGGAPKRFTE
jgi:tetratricopeptide (TPR) repeat protein